MFHSRKSMPYSRTSAVDPSATIVRKNASPASFCANHAPDVLELDLERHEVAEELLQQPLVSVLKASGASAEATR
jgi:hypothetical protein